MAPEAASTKNDEYQEVSDFLINLKLGKYKQKFIEHGIEDNETILELKEEHLEQMGVPLGHKLKIIKRIKDIRGEQGLSTVPQSREGTDRRTPGKAADLKDGNLQPNSSIKGGQFDEKESHNQFLEALNEWRNAPKDPAQQTTESQANDKKRVTFNDE